MIKTLNNTNIQDYNKLKRSEHILKICDNCGNKSTPQWRHAQASKIKQGKDLCQSCAASRDHQKIKTKYGRKLKAGKPGDYIYIWDEQRKRYVAEHQWIIEQMLGFAMVNTKNKIHHINGKKDDNRFENLAIFRNNKSHRLSHGQLEKIAFELVDRNVILFDPLSLKYYINPIIISQTTPTSLDFKDVAIRQKKAIVKSRLDVQIVSEIIKEIHINIPLIASNMSTVTNDKFCILLEKLGSLGVLHRAATNNQLIKWTKNIAKHNKNVAISIGIGISQFELAKQLIQNGANIIFIDVAHGYCDPVIDIGRKIKKYAPSIKIVIGNTINPGLFTESADFADGIKVGIAQGFCCETKNTAGVTEKQFTAIQNCLLASKKYGIPIISDGGIREPADLVKAIGGGASCAMAGKIFASCPKSAALIKNNKKIYEGMASRHVQNQWKGKVSNNAPEGKTTLLDIGESAKNLLSRYAGALRSGISYSGANDIKSFQDNVEFIRL